MKKKMYSKPICLIHVIALEDSLSAASEFGTVSFNVQGEELSVVGWTEEESGNSAGTWF